MWVINPLLCSYARYVVLGVGNGSWSLCLMADYR
jgi:hypothetical protein